MFFLAMAKILNDYFDNRVSLSRICFGGSETWTELDRMRGQRRCTCEQWLSLVGLQCQRVNDVHVEGICVERKDEPVAFDA